VNIVTVSQTHIAFHTGHKGAKRIQGLMPKHLLEASRMLRATPSFKSFRPSANYSSEQVLCYLLHSEIAFGKIPAGIRVFLAWAKR
jgi:hypothetical protein